MKVLKLNTPFELSAVVRIAPFQSDVLSFTIRNEVSNYTASYSIDWNMVNGRIEFTLPDATTETDFKAGNKYELTITNTYDYTIIYRGKLIVVKEDTDIQNYTPSKQTTPRFL